MAIGPRLQDAPKHALLILAAVLTFYPLVFTLLTSFKDNPEFYHDFWGPSLPLHATNYLDAWSQVSTAVVNSVVVTALSVLGIVAFAALSAYVFARHDFPLRNVLFAGVLALLMIPGILTLIPLFLQVKQYGLLNTRMALILPYIAGGQALSIFILRSFLASLPEELFEAARMDGAGELETFWLLAIPLSMPILGTVAIIQVIGIWNDYLWPMVTLANPDLATITLKLVAFTNQEANLQQWGPLFAGYVISAVPLIVLFSLTMRLFIEGLTSGALKL